MTTQPKPSPLPVTFSIRHLKDEKRSRMEGREVTGPQEWIAIRIGGDVLRHEVADRDREQFPLEYEAWKQDRAMPGTPLSLLISEAPEMMTQELVDEIKAFHGVTTLEQLVAIPDGQCKFGQGRALQLRAREVLDRRAEEAAASVVQRRDTESEALKNRVAELEAIVSRLQKIRED